MYCAICGEPWDHYGARHGDDMSPSEYRRLIKGISCPSCKGIRPQNTDQEKLTLKHLDSLFNETE